ncbi:UBC core domain-containing protein [Aphelenchoides besseyi]|nr:UBC core domain-containing protein [Aphelenchoides besseyi]
MRLMIRHRPFWMIAFVMFEVLIFYLGEALALKSSSSAVVKPSTYLVILVMSAPDDVDERQTVRETWLKTSSYTAAEVRPFFIVGTKNVSDNERKRLNAEHSEHNDMIFIEKLVDSFDNLSKKTAYAIEAAVASYNFKFLLKTDTDSFALRDIENPFLYWGFLDGRAKPFRRGKYKEPGYVVCDRYLPYQLGGGYVLSHTLASFIADHVQLLRYYRSEDVSVGVWLAGIHVKYVHDPRFDTEYISRGCNNQYLVTHKHSQKQLFKFAESIRTTGHLCEREFQSRLSYVYDFAVPPSQCCTRVNELMGIVFWMFLSSFLHHICLTRLFGKFIRDQTIIFLVEFACLVLPPLLTHTLLSEYVLSSFVVFGVFCVLLLNYFPMVHTRELSIIRGHKVTVLVSTAVVIAAVDTQIFPRRFEKTRTYGLSPMDLGTGFFICVHSLTLLRSDLQRLFSKNLNIEGVKRKSSTIWNQMPKFLPFLIIGLARTIFILVSGYYQDPVEYGLHWNFFLTLALIQTFISGLRFLFPRHQLVGPTIAFVVGGIYICLLSFTELESYILNLSPNRNGFLDSNREGLCSSLGYLFLFGWSYLVGNYIVPHEIWIGVPVKRKFRTAVCLSANALVHLLLYLLVFYVNGKPSRRAADLCYVLQISMIINVFTVLTFIYQHCIGERSSVASEATNNSLQAAISLNGGLFFLAANLLTGFLNYTRDLLKLNTPIREFIALLVYMFVLCFGAKKFATKK